MTTPVGPTMLSTRSQPVSRITARLIAWEGGFGEHVNEQKMVKEYTAHLKESITDATKETGWRYQRFKTYKVPGGSRLKLEVRVQP